MSIHITQNKIRVTGSDANGFLIAMASDQALLDWERQQIGSKEFQRMVKEAIRARGLEK